MTRLTRAGLIFAIAAACFFVVYQVSHQNISDGKGPVISVSEKERTVSIKDPEKKLLKGVTARDDRDGDVTSSLMVSNLSNFVDGQRVVTYAAFDSEHNSTTATARIRYSDYSHPQIELSQPLSFPVGETEFLSHVKAKDCMDGDISGNVDIRSRKDINVYAAGIYQVELSVSNSAGDRAVVPATLELYEAGNRPAVTLKEYVVYLNRGDSFSPRKYIKSVMVDGRSVGKGSVKIDNPVDTGKTGSYQVTYRLASSKSQKGAAHMTVVVSDLPVMK